MAVSKSRLLCGSIFTGAVAMVAVLGASGSAFAQDLPDVNVQGQADPDATEIEEVVVTGSRIRRDPTNSPTPLITVNRETLLSSGQNTVIDYLATIPALSNSTVPSDTTGTGIGDGGLSLANLRSLGSGRTLTLINGRRQVGSNGGSLAVDVDTVPRLLIENVEIITGGASSVYGADAVSGVLNFVLRRDFEGLEVDANLGMINQDGQLNKRLSVLTGVNLLDDRLNLWAFGEYDNSDEIQFYDVDWLRDEPGLFGQDADPAIGSVDGPNIDGTFDNGGPFFGARQLQIVQWGVTTLANNQPASPRNNPTTAFVNCPAAVNLSVVSGNANCYNVDPAKTYVFEGPTARLANFGTRIGTGNNRVFNIGGDGDPVAGFGQPTLSPEMEQLRFAAGFNFDLTDNVRLSFDAKHTDETTTDAAQALVYQFFITNLTGPDNIATALSTGAFLLRLDDTAFLPSNLRTAIQQNTLQQFSQPTLATGGQPVGAQTSAPYARHILFGPDQTQVADRQLTQLNVALEGDFERLGFVNNIDWGLSYNHGFVDIRNQQSGVDYQRLQLASDAVVDTAGIVNGKPGEIVCRAKREQAENPAALLPDSFRGGDLRGSPAGLASLNACVPLNVFGAGNQSPEALAYIETNLDFTARNEQEQALAFVSGQMFDLFGAGPIGIALGAEWRREYTERQGVTQSVNGRLVSQLAIADFPGAEYETEELFAELSIPLFRDSWLGQYAELSGSYRTFDYTTAGEGDVYGVNLQYRPIQDIVFKASLNTSFRAPNLGENFAPLSPTFYNNINDPCDTRAIVAIANAETRGFRIANCTALFNQVAQTRGLPAPSFDFAGVTADPNDDYNPTYPEGVQGVAGGNPGLKPETSESFTFTVGLQPRFIPNFSLVLDYYEIVIDDVINPVTAANASLNCVNGPSLNASACATIFRNNTPQLGNTAEARSQAFEIGSPGDLKAFIQGSINFAKLSTRGLDFTARYSVDTADLIGRDWGRINYALRGNWLIEQKQFLNVADPNAFTEFASNQTSPRVRFSSELSYSPIDALTVTWTADWQSAQDLIQRRAQVANVDNRPVAFFDTGNFTRHDIAMRYRVSEQLQLRASVTNVFDAEQAPYIGTAISDNFDIYGRRFNIGLNWRPY